MIVVDRCRPCGAPWHGGVACHLISDVDVGELLDFASGIRLPMRWFQARSSVPHFDLSPGWRTKALAAGAADVDLHGMAEAMRRWRTHNPR